jgi:sugar phosphate isomerase/epimerase
VTAVVRPISLAFLSALHVPPPDLVRYAAEAGFDMVGALRLNRASDGSGHDLLTDGRLRRRTATVLRETGLPVLDVEVFRIRPDTRAQDAQPLLEVGAELGARFLLCTVEDVDLGRRADVFADLCRLASSYDLRCVVEPMLFAAVRTPAEAVALLGAGGAQDAGVLVDALHLARAGGVPQDLDGLEPHLLPYLQICDASSAAPAVDGAAALTEAVGTRLAPGDGVLPLRDLLQRLPATAPVSVEAPNPAAREDPLAWVHRLGVATRRLVADALEAAGPAG